MLIGLGKMFKNVASTLASKILGYVYTPSPGSGYYTTTVGALKNGLILTAGIFNPKQYLTQDGNSDYITNLTDGYVRIASNGNIFVVSYIYADGSPLIKYSTDGINWNAATLPPSITSVSSVHYVNNKFIASALASGVYNILNSSDGITWTGVATNYPYESFIWTGDKYIGYSYGNYVAYSTDLSTWTEGQPITGNILKMLVSGSYVYAVSRYIDNGTWYNKLYYSSDGVTWNNTSINNRYNYASYGKLDSASNIMRTIFVNRPSAGVLDVLEIKSPTEFTEYTLDLEASDIIHDGNKFIIPSFGSSGQNSAGIYTTNGVTATFDANLNDYRMNISLSGSLSSTQVIYDNFNNLYYAVPGTTATLFDLPDRMYVGTSIDNLINTEILFKFPQTVGSSYGIGKISTLREVQLSIGNQGSGGESAETLGQVDVYTVPSGKSANIRMITIENLSPNQITYDLGIVDTGTTLTGSNTLKWDEPIPANSTATILNVANPVDAGKTVYVFPSAVDQVQVKVYGTETSI